jgi:hypothetical protein
MGITTVPGFGGDAIGLGTSGEITVGLSRVTPEQALEFARGQIPGVLVEERLGPRHITVYVCRFAKVGFGSRRAFDSAVTPDRRNRP